MKTFYCCSFGGCGSYTLMAALREHGKVLQIHDNILPTHLTYPDGIGDWSNKIVPSTELNDIYVIYIYGNVSNAYMSRGCIECSPCGAGHLSNIHSPNPSDTLENLLIENKDIFGYTDFYNTYTSTTQNRNYKLYCVKFSELNNITDKLSKELGIEKLNVPNIELKSYEAPLNNYIIRNDLHNNILYKNAWFKLNNIFYDVNNAIENSEGFYII